MSASNFSQYSNSSFVEEAHEQVRTKKREKRVKAVESVGTKQWLETTLEDQAKPVPIMGREFYFTPIGNERVEEVLELGASEAANVDPDIDDWDDIDPDDLENMPKLVRAMRETLKEHCTDEYMATEGMGKLPLDVLERVFEDVAEGGQLSESQAERARRFRHE